MSLAFTSCTGKGQCLLVACNQSHLVGASGLLVVPSDGVLHPGHVVTVWEVLAGVSTTTLLAGLSTVHGDARVDEQVLQLKGLDQVGVPDHATVSDLYKVEKQATGYTGGIGSEQ